jgi:anti-sigma B factor antagonist
MQVTVEPRDNFTILHLRGEFDTFYCALLQKEIDGLIASGVNRIALNLRLVKFINSTALGAIIKASKILSANGGKLVISRPSVFCKDIMEKVGLDRVVPLHATDEAAGAALLADAPDKGKPASEDELDDETAILFSPTDPKRVEHFIPESARSGKANPVHKHTFGGHWRGVGRMCALDNESLRFTWNGGSSGLSPFEMGQMLSLGTDLTVKFRLPLLQKGHCEAVVTVSEVEERPDGVKLGATFSEI